MGLFSRNKPPVELWPFWQVPPFPSTDPDVLYQHGITCVTSSDGQGMLSVGWTLWDLVGLNQYQAWDFIKDGFQEWLQSGAPLQERANLLNDMLVRLDQQPQLPVDIDLHSLQPGVVEPTVPYYTARCWAISELLGVHDAMSTLTPEVESEMLDRLLQIHLDFMPQRTMSQFNALRNLVGTRRVLEQAVAIFTRAQEEVTHVLTLAAPEEVVKYLTWLKSDLEPAARWAALSLAEFRKHGASVQDPGAAFDGLYWPRRIEIGEMAIALAEDLMRRLNAGSLQPDEVGDIVHRIDMLRNRTEDLLK